MEQTSNTALLVMEMQEGILTMMPEATSAITENIARAIAGARHYNILVIYVLIGFRDNVPALSQRELKGFLANKAHSATMNMEEFMKIHPDLTPRNGEITIVKRRVSAFTGSDLEVILRSSGIQHIVLTGISTSGVVLSTLREAADKDYRLTVLLDCCTDPDEKIHNILITRIFPDQAEVLTVDEWCNWW